MIKITTIILIAIHGIIHLFGFLKAFRLFEFDEISLPISRISGLFWLVTFVLFLITTILYFVRINYWWTVGLIATLISQILIIKFWSDSKYGTIANLIVLIAILFGYLNSNFKNIIKKERNEMFNASVKLPAKNHKTKEINSLPVIIQKWLHDSGIIGKPTISNVYLTQDLQLKFKPEQEEWNYGTSEQYFTINPPAFNWDIKTQMNPLMSIIGRDKFEKGKAEMLIKLFALVPVVIAKNNKKIDQSALQRFLAEMIWFPSAALSEYLTWEKIDEFSAKATMEYNGSKGSGIFYFNGMGQFEKFVTMRFKDPNDAKPIKWTVKANKIEMQNGIKIPIECEVIWNLESEDWTWLKLKVKHIEYNVKKMPVTNN